MALVSTNTILTLIIYILSQAKPLNQIQKYITLKSTHQTTNSHNFTLSFHRLTKPSKQGRFHFHSLILIIKRRVGGWGGGGRSGRDRSGGALPPPPRCDGAATPTTARQCSGAPPMPASQYQSSLERGRCGSRASAVSHGERRNSRLPRTVGRVRARRAGAGRSCA